MKELLLVGTPNSGKSSLFNFLSKKTEHTGNWAGKTVKLAEKKIEIKNNSYHLVDLPGTYSLIKSSSEEELSTSYLLNDSEKIIIFVADATSLSRSLSLLYQLLPLNLPTILFVNLLDEAPIEIKKLREQHLSLLLGIPVIFGSVRKKMGLNKLTEIIEEVNEDKFPFYIRTSYLDNESIFGNSEPLERNIRNLILNSQVPSEESKESLSFLKSCSLASLKILPENLSPPLSKLDRFFYSKIGGTISLFIILFLSLFITIYLANFPSSWLLNFFEFLEIKLLELSSFLNVIPIVESFLIRGIFRTTAWVLAVMLPPMAIFFPLFLLFENIGLLPRLVFSSDRFFQLSCAHPKQCFSMCMGLGCNAAGVEQTRIIDSKKEREIAILTNNFIPCNGRFPTLIALSSILFSSFNSLLAEALTVTIFILIGYVISLVASYFLSKIMNKREKGFYFFEVPKLRKPSFKAIFISSTNKTYHLMMRALIISSFFGALIFLLATITFYDVSLMNHFILGFEELGLFLGLDGVILNAFVLSFPANEIILPLTIMGYLGGNILPTLDSLDSLNQVLLSNSFTSLKAFNFLLLLICHIPCGTTLATIFHETKSRRLTLFSILIPMIIGLTLTCLINYIFSNI